MRNENQSLSHLRTEIEAMLADGKRKAVIASILKEKYHISDNVETIRSFVRKCAKQQEDKGLQQECKAVGLPVEDVTNYWYKGKHYSIHFRGKQVSYFDICDELITQMKSHAPDYKAINHLPIVDGHLLVIDPADVHIGKLCSAFETGDEYNSKIAIERVKQGVMGIIAKAAGFKIDKILYIIGNDKLHIDTPKSTTTSGTHQDSDLMWYDAFKIAVSLDREIIEMLSLIAPVHVQYDPSNHDYQTGFFLAHSLEAWFSKNPNITFNVSIAHRKYFVYGNSLIGTTHGDGAKETDLAMLMAHEAQEHWAHCRHRYFYTHHIHHKRSKDYMSVCVEALRSPSGTDSWHSRNGFQHAPKAVEGFIHSKEHGQISRFTHIF